MTPILSSPKTSQFFLFLKVKNAKLLRSKNFLTAFILFFCMSILQAATITSTATGGAWNTASTWLGGTVPALGDNVIIATTGSGSVNLTATVAQTTAGSVTVNNGALLTLSGGVNTFGALTVNNGGTITVRRTTTILGTTTISGRINFGSTFTTKRNFNFNGAITLNSTAIWDETNLGNNTVANGYNIKSNFVNNAAVFTPLTASVHTFSNTGTLSGSTVFTIPRATFTGSFINNGILISATLLTVTTTSLTNNGTITTGTALSGTGGLIQGSSAILNIGGTSAITTLNATASGNIVSYTGAAQTVHTGNYSALNLSGSGTKTFTTGTTSIETLSLSGTASATTVANLAIANNLTVGTNAAFTTGSGFTQSVGGTTSISGSLNLNGTATKTFTGDFILNTGSSYNEAAASTINFGANFTNNASTFTANTGAHNFTGAAKIISGTAVSVIPTATFTGAYSVNSPLTSATLLTITGVTVTNNSSLTASTSLTGTGTLIQGTTGILNIGGTMGLTSFNAAASGNTVNYSGSAQTGFVTSYSNLMLSGSGFKTFSTSPTVNAVLSFEGTATANVTSGAINYGPAATLQFDTSTARIATSEEWITPFLATGGIIIKNTGAITTPGAVQLGNNTNVPLNISSGATLTPGANLITFHGDFINNGTITSGTGGITIAGTTAVQYIDDFISTGTVTLSKTSGTATMVGNMTGGNLNINGTGGSLNLGVGMNHTLTGMVSLTSGVLNGGSSILNVNSISATAWNGTGNIFAPATGTVNFAGLGDQTIAANSSFFNLGFSGSGIKTLNNATTINNNLSISGSASGNLGTGLSHTALSLILAGSPQVPGSWGSSASSAVNKSAMWFGSTGTGIINISCNAPNAPISGGNKIICSGKTIPPLTVTLSAGQEANWYNQASGGSLLQANSTSFTPTLAGTYYVETKVTVSGCISATRTAVILTINPTPTILSLTGSSICTTPGGNGTISSTTSQTGVNYQLYNSSSATVQSVKAGTGNALSWSALIAGNGYYVIETNATTGCSTTSNTVNILSNANPNALILTGSTICASPGGDGIITSTASQSGIDYQLYNASDILVQSPVSGTGNSLSWTGLDAGNGYYVKGTSLTTGCASGKSNSVNISTSANPTALVLTGSKICVSPGGNGTITSSTSVIGVDYQLMDSAGNDIGTPLSGTGLGLTFTAVPVGTGYYVDGTNISTGCDSPSSNPVDISTNPNPSNKPVTASSASVCTGTGAQILVAGSLSTESYQLRNNSGNGLIGTPVNGNGGSLSLPTGNLSATTTFNVIATTIATGCTTTLTATPTITVTANNTAGTASANPIVCVNTLLSNITITTIGATGISNNGVSGANGLPAGVSALWSANVITISGTPTASGTFNYSIQLNGGCGTANASGTITVTPANTASTASSAPTLCVNKPLTAITHSTTGASGIGTSIGLPAGVSASWSGNVITISGTPTASGTFNYSIPVTGGCPGINATGTITVTPANTASAASPSLPVCVNTALTPVTHTTTGATGIGTALNLPPGISAIWSANVITLSGVPTAVGIFNYSIALTGGCGNANATGTITVNGVTSSSSNRFINGVKFLGTLDPDITNTSAYSPNGYADYKNLLQKAKQIPGGVINLNVSAGVITGTPLSTVKAWVDWNKDGIFNDNISEKVYDTSEAGALAGNVIFGYVVPLNTQPGLYTIRIRINSGSGIFGPCGNTADGETEDYNFVVIANCAAKVLSITAGQQCGLGPVVLNATATADTSSYAWYDSEFGAPIADATGSTYTTISLTAGTYTYYVTANNGSCISTFRTPVRLTVSPTPLIELSQNVPDICGAVTSMVITASGGKEEVTLLQDKFENTLENPLRFENIIDGNTSIDGVWQLRNTPYVPDAPPYNILKPAISSGYEGGNFINIISDVRQTTDIVNYYATKKNIVTTNVSQLKLDFDLYYFSEEDVPEKNYFKVQYTTNGTEWKDLRTDVSDVGVPSRFSRVSLDLPEECNNITTLKLRFKLFALGSSAEWIADIVAIDNVRVYGLKDLSTNLTWTGDSGVIYDNTCTGVPPLNGSDSVCIKFAESDIRSRSAFTITGTASLASGCTATGTLLITNNSKIWNSTVSQDWNSNNWNPADNTGPPNEEKCVIIKQPLVLGGTGADGFAKNIMIESNGSLTLKKDRTLTVTDYLKNETTLNNETNLLLETDANLIQINATAPNSGKMTAQREVAGLRYNPGTNSALNAVDYVYWSSPVFVQKTKGAGGFSPGTPNSRFYYYRESNDRFYETPDLTFIPGRGYAVQAESTNNLGTPYTKTYEFKGAPNNGNIGIILSKSPDNPAGTVHGFNLVGNPYPSNINFEELSYANSNLIWGTAWFWTNSVYTPTQMGSGYNGNNYAIWNGSGGVAATSPYSGGLIPNGIVKVGQAFIVQAKGNGVLIFKNKYDDSHILRVNTSGNFYSRNGAPKNRFWISLLSPSQLSNSQLIAYVEGATDGFENDFDAEAFGDFSDAFYSILPAKKLMIQGKNKTFTVEDKIILGANFFQNGTYSIALETAEGIFEGGQNIYLKDKQTGVITNLSQGSYVFEAIKGDTAGRFEIIYKPETVLATGGSIKEQIIIYRDADNFVIKSPTIISMVELYDNSGKLIKILNLNSTTAVLDVSALPNGGYILKIKTKAGELTSKKILK